VNHRDAAPLTADGIVPASFLSRGARLKKKKLLRFPPSSVFHASAPFGFTLPNASPPLRHPPRRLTIHQFRRRLRDQNYHVIWLIGMYGPLHRVRYSLSCRPDVVVVSTLRDCFGLQDFIVGAFVSVDAHVFDDLPALEDLSR